MTAYYNEIDPYAAQWLRNLIEAGHIAPGEVDERSIVDVRPDDLRGFTQCHFFAGIGVWSYALRLAGWPDDRQVWTFSEPCQPFSQAGRGAGTSDERYLRPYMHHLVRVCRPSIAFGEQVASKDGLGWFDTLQTDMEGEGYACAAIDTCSAGVGAPHIRQRLRVVAKRLADTECNGQHGSWNVREAGRNESTDCSGASGRLGNSECQGLERHGRDVNEGHEPGRHNSNASGPATQASTTDGRVPGPTNGFWRDADWLSCRDGKWRPVRPGSFPLAHGAPSRVGRLRAFGNCIDAQATKVFIESVMECI